MEQIQGGGYTMQVIKELMLVDLTMYIQMMVTQ
jgi:hypothetical protein